MITYHLNRKQNVQDSCYARSMLFDRVVELSASERTKARMDHLVCVNKKGKPGQGIHRDKENEIRIRETKTSIRGMHCNLKDLTLEKTMSSLSIINQITQHDMESMLCEQKSQTSYNYLGPERTEDMRKEIERVNPFSRTRPKQTFYDKSRGSPFSGMTVQKLENFVERNKKNFLRKFHAKLL